MKKRTVAYALTVARNQLGTVEKPTNRTKYGRWFGMDGVPWCDIFISWVLHRAGFRFYKSAWTPGGAAIFRKQAEWHIEPQPGDIAYFDFPGDGIDRISHVGIVEQVHAGGTVITTIEGNTSAGNAGAQRDGGGLGRRTRARVLVVGFGRPPYEPDSTESPKRPKAKKKVTKPEPLLRSGSRGPAVRTWQQQLRDVGGYHLADDGIFGPRTAAITRLFQKHQRLRIDGIVGPNTRAAMGRLYAKKVSR